MARKPQVRYFQSRQAFYCQHDGKQHCLAKSATDDSPNGVGYLEALSAFKRLLETGTTKEATQQGDGLRFFEVVNFYLTHLETKGEPKRTLRFNQATKECVERLGMLGMDELKAYHVQEWLASMSPRWNDNTKSLSLRLVCRAVNFAVKQGRIASSPLKSVERPQETSRGEEFYMNKELRKVLLANARGDFAHILSVMEATGCRPVEVEQAEAFNYNRELKCLIFKWNAKSGYVWKNARKQRKDRVIFLPDNLAAIVEEKIKERPTGKLFRTKRDTAFMVGGRGDRWRILTEKKPVAAYFAEHGVKRENVIMYGYRHSFITDWLLSGRSIKVCADLTGTSVAMIEKTYGHMVLDNQHMRKMACSFMDEK